MRIDKYWLSPIKVSGEIKKKICGLVLSKSIWQMKKNRYYCFQKVFAERRKNIDSFFAKYCVNQGREIFIIAFKKCRVTQESKKIDCCF